MTINVGIYLYNEIEVLDFAGPFEVFSTASRVNTRLEPGSNELFNVFTVAEDTKPICARGGLKIIPRHSIKSHPKMDILIIPGGIVTDDLENENVISWIKTSSNIAEITASVCTGAFLLAKSGLLKSKCATTHWEDINDLHSMFPDIKIKKNVRWVDEGSVVTAAGISAGIDMSLHLISRAANEDLAFRTAKQMEFEWTKNS
ncbi:MAG: DJ-1/PfpI family protein [archaeon]|nr:DJ-1/PfpI family protein [archaeon]